MELLMIAGLGNPGGEYTLTRHNAGADYVKLLCDKKSLALKKEKQINGSFAELTTEKYKLIFVVPSTYMNESGLSVAKSKKFFNLETDQILIAHDELDLPKSEIVNKRICGLVPPGPGPLRAKALGRGPLGQGLRPSARG